MECWMAANEVQNQMRKNVMLAIIGGEAFELLAALCAPQQVTDKTYDELCTMLDNHYTRGTNELAESYNFDTRCQKDNESVSEYIVELKKLSIHCGFGDDEQVKKRLRNRLVAGLKSDAIKNKLLAEGAALTWNRAEELAITMDVAHKNANMMKTSGEVNKVRHSYGKPKPKPQQGQGLCHRCNGEHPPSACRFKDASCYRCKKTGHIARACRSRTLYRGLAGASRGASRGTRRGFHQGQGRGRGRGSHTANEVQDEAKPEHEVNFANLYAVAEVNAVGRFTDEYVVEVKVNGVNLPFALDTCSKFTVVEEDVYYKHFSNVTLEKPSIKLRSYSGHDIPLLGQIAVHVEYEGQKKNLMLFIAKGRRTPLFGRDWLNQIKLDWRKIFSVNEVKLSNTNSLQATLRRHGNVFNNSFGEIKEFEARVELKDATPRFFKARHIPYALQDRVKSEIDRLEKIGVLKKVERSDFASPQVVVPKKDGTLRLCGDYKVSINEHIVDQPYMLPTAEDLFATLTGGEKFTTLDLSQAYAQVKVEECSQKYLTVNTIKGLYQVTRLPYGIKSAPHIFQSIMDQILQGIPGVCCYLDDILITAKSDEEHLRRLETVLQRLEKYNVKLRKDKCTFLASEVKYLGHVIDKSGRKPVPEKIKAIVESKPPNDVSELRTFLGMINYYGSFLKNLSDRLAPLNNLLRKEVPWKWGNTCQKAFEDVKSSIISAEVLTHYDVQKKLVLACDASPHGIGAVLSHEEKSTERPIAFASRTLTAAESKYPQIEKEALAIMYGVKKFHKYLYGRKFTLITDHNPLTYIFGPYEGIPTLAALRLQRWALLLSAYDYNIVYRKSAENANADYLSRAPVDKAIENIESEVNHFTHVNDMPVSASDIAAATRKDPVLSRVLSYSMNGWPGKVDDEYLPFFQRREEISVDQEVLLWGMRVIIPQKLQERMLNEIHMEHLGIVRMKALARSYFWFPGIDSSIEAVCKSCSVCMSLKKDPPPSPLYPWKYPERPWDRIHIDFAEFKGQNYLVCVDAHSKWIEVINMSSTTSTKTVDVLREMFARYGIPRELTSDNGPQLVSEEFETFLKQNGVKHSLSPPYHPASNGLAERAVQTVKNALKKHFIENDLSDRRLQSFLLTYRNTPHATTGVSPAELFFKRTLRTRLSLLKPDIVEKVTDKQLKMKEYRDDSVPKLREFKISETVRVKNCRDGLVKYVPGVIIAQKGPVQYLVRVGMRTRYVHVDHLLKTGEPDNITALPTDTHEHMTVPDPVQNQPPVSETPEFHQTVTNTPSGQPTTPARLRLTSTPETPAKPSAPKSPPVSKTPMVRPKRTIKMPERFSEFKLG